MNRSASAHQSHHASTCSSSSHWQCSPTQCGMHTFSARFTFSVSSSGGQLMQPSPEHTSTGGPGWPGMHSRSSLRFTYLTGIRSASFRLRGSSRFSFFDLDGNGGAQRSHPSSLQLNGHPGTASTFRLDTFSSGSSRGGRGGQPAQSPSRQSTGQMISDSAALLLVVGAARMTDAVGGRLN